jgi:hypothetical protein
MGRGTTQACKEIVSFFYGIVESRNFEKSANFEGISRKPMRSHAWLVEHDTQDLTRLDMEL